MPNIRGMENPHTSASKIATERSLSARATARLAERDDLPTPPLPEAISRQRVLVSLNGSVSLRVLWLSVSAIGFVFWLLGLCWCYGLCCCCGLYGVAACIAQLLMLALPSYLLDTRIFVAMRHYFDHASTSPLRPVAKEAMLAALEVCGDPGRIYAEALEARGLVEQAREQVAHSNENSSV